MRYCSNCEYNDGRIYTSLPPQYKCTLTKEYHLGDAECDIEFVPVVHGEWIREESGNLFSNYCCSKCGLYAEGKIITCGWNYCPNCGAKMDGEVKEDAE